MAKKIKFPLEMKNSVMVRTLEELQVNFDAEKLIGHWLSGKLQTWLLDRHYEDQLLKINAINTSGETLLVELCEALEIDIDRAENKVKVDEIANRQERLKVIRQYTDDKNIIEHIDDVAMNQIELEALLHRQVGSIYLYREAFCFGGMSIKNVSFIGIDNPIIKVETDSLVDFDEMNVQFYGCKFDDKYLELLESKQIEEENKHKKKRKEYVASSIFDYKLDDKDQNQYKKLYDKVQEELVDFEFDVDAGTNNMYKIVVEADIYGVFDIDRYGREIKGAADSAKLNDVWENFLNRMS